MCEDRDDIPLEAASAGLPAEDRLARLAAILGLELPPFEGPLDAFVLGEDPEGVPAYHLGGDLHAVYPEAPTRRQLHGRDHSLDAARITLDDEEHETVEATAVEGIWCIPMPAELVDSAPLFTLTDTQGRLRSWLLIPPARLMVGLGHFWLPAVPSRPRRSPA
jgi:hypothetical protein